MVYLLLQAIRLVLQCSRHRIDCSEQQTEQSSSQDGVVCFHWQRTCRRRSWYSSEAMRPDKEIRVKMTGECYCI